MWALQIWCAKEVIIKRLRSCLEEELDRLKKYKEEAHALHGEVNALTEQVKKLNGAIRWVEELTKANAILTAKVASLHETLDKAKVDAVEEHKDSQSFFNLLGSQYGEGFKDFRK